MSDATEEQASRDAQTTIQEEQLTVRDHLDPDKHWIGEALPPPSVGEVKSSGVVTAVGASPFVARADHSHDNRTYYGVFQHPALIIAPGQVFINNLTFWFGRNMLAPSSSQIILFPVEGIWEVIYNAQITRVGGGVFAGQFNVVFYYNNGGYGREIYRADVTGMPVYNNFTAIDHSHYSYADNTTNIQIAIQHNDSVNWSIASEYVEARRLSSYGTA